MSRGRNPLRNQAEHGTPQTSPSGLVLRQSGAELTAWTGATYLPYVKAGIVARLGDFQNRDYASVPVVHRRAYSGQAPLELHPTPPIPHPWE